MLSKSKIKEFAKVGSGQGAPQRDTDFTNEGFPFIRAGSLEDLLNGREETELPKVNEAIAREYRLKLYHPNTIVFAKSGMSALKGRIYKLKKPCYVVNHLATLELLETAIPDYIVYTLRYFSPVKLINDNAYPSLKQSTIESYEVPFPKDRKDQLHIANLLSKAENLIAQRKESIRLLDEYLKSTFLEMFGDPVRNEKNWNTIPFLEVGKFKSGGTPSKERTDFWDGAFPWVSPKDMKVSKIVDSQDHISSIVFQETTLKRIPRYHLLIVVRGMILAHSFPVAINYVEVAINQDMKAILPNRDLNIIFLQHCLGAMKRQILDLMSSAGHGTRKLDASAMRKLLIPVPTIELQTQFSKIVEKVEALRTQYQQSLKELENLYGSLSQRAFRGELSFDKTVTV